MKKICIFANFFINDKERFLRTIDSFKSFNKAKINSWVINARGEYSKDLYSYLKKKINKNKFFFSNLDSGNWFEDTKKILRFIDTKLVFIWTEDHININNQKYFDKIVNDMIKNQIEYLQYSWFNTFMLNSFKKFFYYETKNLIYLNYDFKKHKQRLKFYHIHNFDNLFEYIISHQSIMTKKLFFKLINKNRFGFFKKNLPFSLEKNKKDVSWLPYKIGIVKNEFFAAIDDDKYMSGYSLISRGLYKDRLPKYKKILIQKNRVYSPQRYNLIGKIYFFPSFEVLKSFIKKIINYY